MPRGGRSSSRPSMSSSHGPSGSRSASTAAYPQHQQAYPAHNPAAQQQGKQPGLMAQAASTMGGAVAGSVVGHGISNMLFGSSRPAEGVPPPAEMANQQQQMQGASCDVQAKDFTKCLEATNGDMQSCSYYLEALKACQAAARPY